MGFTTILEAPGLSPAARRRARAAGPRAVAMRSDHQRLLRAAGVCGVIELDVAFALAATGATQRLRGTTSRPAQHAGRHPRRAAAPRPPPRSNKRKGADGERLMRPGTHALDHRHPETPAPGAARRPPGGART